MCRVDEVADLEATLLGLRLQADTGQIGEDAHHGVPVPEVIDMPGPGIVRSQARRVVDFRSQAGDQDIGLRNTVLLHHPQRRIQAATRGNTEGGALAVIPDHVDEAGQRIRIAQQVLVKIREECPVMIQRGTARRRNPRDRYRPRDDRAQDLQVTLNVCLPGIMPVDALDAVAGQFLPGLAVAEYFQQGLFDRRLVQRIDQVAIVAVPRDVAGTAVLGRNDRQAARRRLDQSQAKGSVRAGLMNTPREVAASRYRTGTSSSWWCFG